ncbi:MAG TPA: DUF6279 family lipoprotein [Burkholderiaceae bacterium]|nr:DUF6279 family lipoprotein [Burkholderiaceae bacterium]HPH13179.1 DUF6279 family lipoprotein [Burkholderiaceae bacterium]
MTASLKSVVRWVGIIGLMTSVVMLGACSAVKIGYNNVPDLAYWWLDGYADFNETQSSRVRDELLRLHQWHRATELPKAAELLQKTRELVPKEVSPEQVCSLFADLRSRLEAVHARAEPGIVAVAMSLTPAQLSHMEAKFGKANSAWRSDWLEGTPEEKLAKRMKSAVERAEQVYGTLEETQLAIVRASIARSGFDPQLSYAERLRRQQDLLQTLRQITTSRESSTLATTALRGYLDRSLNSPNTAYRAYSGKALLDSCRATALLHNSTSVAQRERAAQRLAAYERDFRELAAQP